MPEGAADVVIVNWLFNLMFDFQLMSYLSGCHVGENACEPLTCSWVWKPNLPRELSTLNADNWFRILSENDRRASEFGIIFKNHVIETIVFVEHWRCKTSRNKSNNNLRISSSWRYLFIIDSITAHWCKTDIYCVESSFEAKAFYESNHIFRISSDGNDQRTFRTLWDEGWGTAPRTTTKFYSASRLIIQSFHRVSIIGIEDLRDNLLEMVW